MKNTLYAGFLLSLLVLSTCNLAYSEQAKPKLVTTLHPIGLIAAEIMGSFENITVLLPATSSPHHYQLKPSHVRALNQADLVIWVGQSLEMFMNKPIAQLKHKGSVLTLEEIPGLTLLSYRANALWPHQTHDHSSHAHVHKDTPNNIDGHLWLSTHNAIAMASHIAKRLVKLDPVNSTDYRTNLALFTEKIEQLDKHIRKKMTPYNDTPYLVYHDAFQYFESQYALKPLGAFLTDGAQGLSAKRLRALNRIIKTNKIRCIFADRQYDPSLPKKVASQTGASLVTLDPIGVTISMENGGYMRLLETISKNMLSCLSK